MSPMYTMYPHVITAELFLPRVHTFQVGSRTHQSGVYIYMHTRARTNVSTRQCTHTYIYTHIHTYTHTHIHTYTHTHIHTYTYFTLWASAVCVRLPYVHIPGTHVNLRVRARTKNVLIYMHTRTHQCVCMSSHTDVRTHVHLYTALWASAVCVCLPRVHTSQEHT